MPYEIDEISMMSPEDVAGEYGGDKRKIGQAVQLGILNPLVGVMAGMFIDKMRSAAVQEQEPLGTVAQDTLPMSAPAGLGATQVAQQMAPQMPAAPATPVMAASGGLMDLPVSEDMVPDEYAGGGIVAFQNEGFVDPIFSAPDATDPYARERTPSQYEKFTKDLTLPELQEYFRSGKVPDRLKGQEPTGFGSRGAPLLGTYTGYDRAKPASKARDEDAAPVPRPQDRTSRRETEGEGRETTAAAPAAAQTDYAKMVEDLKKRFGVTDDAEIKGREALAKYREKLTSDIDKAGALGMIQAGLGIAGGKSRYALQNLQGAMPAITEYAKAQEKIRGEERGILDSEIKLDQAADARRRGDMGTALKLEQDAKELAVRERQVRAAERQAGRMGAEAEVIDRYAKAKGISFDKAAREIAEMRGDARNPLNAFIAEQIRAKGNKGQIDIREMIEKYPGLAPTR